MRRRQPGQSGQLRLTALALLSVSALALAACSSGELRTSTPTHSTRTGAVADVEPNEEPAKAIDVDEQAEEPTTPPKPTRSTPPPQQPRDKPQRKPLVRYLVTRVIDGDTVELAKGGGTTVRIIGIDTPETVHPSEPVECGGPEASAAASRLLTGKHVRLVYDPSQGRVDTYGRTLGYLLVPGLGDFGLAMLRRGHAAEYTYDSAYTMQSQYIRAESRAQRLGAGVWDACGGVDTPHLQEPAPKTVEPSPNQGSGCDPGYDPCVPAYPPDLDCDDIDGPVHVTGSDPHGFDADGDGTGCDS